MLRYFTDWYLWYYIILAIMGFIYVQQKNKSLSHAEGQSIANFNNKENDKKFGLFFCMLTFLPLVLIAGNRGWDIARIYGDTGNYITIFEKAPSTVGELLEDIDWNSRNPGFLILNSLIKQFISSDYRVFFFIIASIQALCLMIGYRRYSSDIVTCAFLFFASSDFMSWMMNGIRQFIVVAILFAVFPLVQKRKFIPFLLIVLILFSIHKSVLIVIPLYLCALGKPFNKRTIILLGLILIALVFTGEFTNLLDDSLQGSVYSNMVSEFGEDNGTNILRVLVYSIPAIIAVLNRKKITEDTPEIVRISVNMSLFTAALFMLSVPISGIYMGRLPIYCSLFNYILLPWELKNLFEEDMYKILKVSMFVLYLAFYTYQMLQWGI